MCARGSMVSFNYKDFSPKIEQPSPPISTSLGLIRQPGDQEERLVAVLEMTSSSQFP